jgi:hypothetical protein
VISFFPKPICAKNLRRKHYLRPGEDLTLDWRPLYKQLKSVVLPNETGYVHSTTMKRNVRTLTRMCAFAPFYFDPQELMEIFEEILPLCEPITATLFHRWIGSDILKVHNIHCRKRVCRHGSPQSFDANQSSAAPKFRSSTSTLSPQFVLPSLFRCNIL